ncbi:MAG: CRTAC1 family protein [bacterium]|nr:CRTAC1 family protein [bacterium]
MRFTRMMASLAMILISLSCGQWDGKQSQEQTLAEKHLTEALDLMRTAKVQEAGHALDAATALSGDSPDLLFHRARLQLQIESAGPGSQGGLTAATELLREVVRLKPDSVKAHRLLYEIERRNGNREAAEHHRLKVVSEYGQLGELEMITFASLLRAENRLFLTRSEIEMTGDAEIDRFLTEVKRLRRGPDYAPIEAVPAIDEIFARHPELASLRFLFAKYLVFGQVRLADNSQGGIGRISSKFGLDLARRYLEQSFDQLDPGSVLALQNVLWLARIAVRSTDYEAGLSLCSFALDSPLYLDSAARSRLVGQKAVSLYKLGRFDEVVSFLTPWFSAGSTVSNDELDNRWLLHLAHEKLDAPPENRRQTFNFRPDIADPDPTHLFFDDIAPDLGIDKLDGYGPNAWGDYDGDGDFDLYVSGGETHAALFRNDGNRFSEVSETAGLHQIRSCFSSTFADVNNDGWPDLYLGRDGWAGPGPNSLYRNNGDGTFTDITESAGLGDPSDTFVHSWSDVDRDGFIDLFVANGITMSGSINRFYHNNGDGTFSDLTAQVGLAEPPGNRTIGVAFADYNGDDWPDLFISGYQTLNRLYRNRGDGTFDEVAGQAGIDGAGHLSTGYVCFFVDLDNDGWPDVLRTALAPWDDVLLGLSDKYDTLSDVEKRHLAQNGPRLYRNNRDGTFTEIAMATGLVHPVGNMGANVADVDNDGWVDLYFGTGDPGLSRMEPDRFYHANGDGTYTERTFAAGLGHIGKGHGITFIDLDDDGDLEIYAAEGGMVFGDMWANAFYLNRQSSGNNWIHIDLEGSQSNRDGVGTKIIVKAGRLTQWKERRNGVGFGSSDSPTVEFGVGGATEIESLRLRWPSGLEQDFSNIPVNQRVYVREGQPWVLWEDRTPR